MKATKYIFIALAAVLALGACSKNVWIDNAEPKAYFSQYGYSQNTVWNVDAGTYTVNFGINIGGLRPDNRKTAITVGYAVNPAITDSAITAAVNTAASLIFVRSLLSSHVCSVHRYEAHRCPHRSAPLSA